MLTPIVFVSKDERTKADFAWDSDDQEPDYPNLPDIRANNIGGGDTDSYGNPDSRLRQYQANPSSQSPDSRLRNYQTKEQILPDINGANQAMYYTP